MARVVPLSTCAPRAGLTGHGPRYTIHEDPPWLDSASASAASSAAKPSPSIFIDELDFDPSPPAMRDDGHPAAHRDAASSSPVPAPLAVKKPGYQPSTFAHPRQDTSDDGPQSRPSRMPIFKQVRSMLSTNKGSTPKWDELSGEPSDTGKESHVRPSTYKSPYEGAFQASRRSPDPSSRLRASAASPVSALIDDDFDVNNWSPDLALQRLDSATDRPLSPVSPVSTLTPGYAPSQQTITTTTGRTKTEGSVFASVKRKPVAAPQDHSANLPPTPDFTQHSFTAAIDPPDREIPASHFSWTTAARSDPRQSTDTRHSRQRSVTNPDLNKSHFSWSTVATAATAAHHPREHTPPPSPPPMPPTHPLQTPNYGHPPVQSILSRQRPYKRHDSPAWAPPPSTALPSTPRSLSPRIQRPPQQLSTTPTAEGKKALPLPPASGVDDSNSGSSSPASTTNPTAAKPPGPSRLESLQTRERNLALQRRNIQRAIADLERVQAASPLDVSFAKVREARRKLDERRLWLDDVRKEEMEVGIGIARVRRKEDFADGEGTLWVRRVTG